MLEEALARIKSRGHADAGECTMIDAFQPAVESLKAAATSHNEITKAFTEAARAALNGAGSTKNMIGKHGRAKYAGERSLGHIDPEAMSTYFLFKAMSDYFNK